MVRQRAMLVARVGGLACAFPIEHVVEVMRPLPVEPLGTTADPALAMIDGLTIIRGAAVPVIDLRKLLGTGARTPAARIIVVRIPDVQASNRQLAVAVDAVLDVRPIDHAALSALPPLVTGAARDCLSAIGARDGQLVVVLEATRILPADSWHALAPAHPAGPP